MERIIYEKQYFTLWLINYLIIYLLLKKEFSAPHIIHVRLHNADEYTVWGSSFCAVWRLPTVCLTLRPRLLSLPYLYSSILFWNRQRLDRSSAQLSWSWPGINCFLHWSTPLPTRPPLPRPLSELPLFHRQWGQQGQYFPPSHNSDTEQMGSRDSKDSLLWSFYAPPPSLSLFILFYFFYIFILFQLLLPSLLQFSTPYFVHVKQLNFIEKPAVVTSVSLLLNWGENPLCTSFCRLSVFTVC